MSPTSTCASSCATRCSRCPSPPIQRPGSLCGRTWSTPPPTRVIATRARGSPLQTCAAPSRAWFLTRSRPRRLRTTWSSLRASPRPGTPQATLSPRATATRARCRRQARAATKASEALATGACRPPWCPCSPRPSRGAVRRLILGRAARGCSEAPAAIVTRTCSWSAAACGAWAVRVLGSTTSQTSTRCSGTPTSSPMS